MVGRMIPPGKFSSLHREGRTRRRDFVAGTAAAVGATLCTNAVRAVELGRARTISIFHTTDLHGRILPTSSYEGLDDVGGFARCASCIRQWRRESPHSITVDVGDVVQGTAVSMQSGGRLMIDLFNRLGYDAWALGNHDFDWGPEKLEVLLAASSAPILTANITRGGRPPGGLAGGWAKVRPWIIREVGGFRIGLIGLITPGLDFWLSAETLGGVEATDPAATLAATVKEVRDAGADAVVALGHMGWRFHDDYANPVRTVLRAAEGVDVYLAGHSHQNQPSWTLHDVLCSQASYYGIHCGRIDLTFDLDSRRLVDRRGFTLLMDDRFALDPLVIEMARPDLASSDEQLARRLATVRSPIRGGGRGSPLAALLCELFAAALARAKTPVDGVFHGTFDTGGLEQGDCTVADCWRIIPYENLLVTAELSAAELLTIAREDASDKRSDRTLWPFTLVRDGDGGITGIGRDGRTLAGDERLRIAFNSYDSQSGGRRLLKTRSILEQPAARRVTTGIDTRSALIDGLLDKGSVG